MRNGLLHETAKKGILITAHRGSCGGNLSQNNILTMKAALLQGADILELDVIMSKDKKFYVFHDNQEKHVLHLDDDIRNLSSKQIDELVLYNWLDYPSGIKVSKLEEVLDAYPDTFINIDRSWYCWDEILEFLSKRNTDHILLKCHAQEELLEKLQEKGKNIPFMPIVFDKKGLDLCLQYDINMVAVEILFNTLDSELISDEMFRFYKEKGLLTFVNCETISCLEKHNVSAGLDDNNAIIKGFDETWGRLADMGFDIIQTDWVSLLKNYLNSRKM